MKLFIYVILTCFFVIAGCSGDDAPKAQSVEQAGTSKKSESALGHYAGQVELANEAKKMQEEAEKKQKELEQGI